MTDKIIVMVTCGSRKDARKIARALVGQRLAACVSEIGVPVASTYRWKGRVESAKEILLLIKTNKKRFAEVRDFCSRTFRHVADGKAVGKVLLAVTPPE